MDISGVEQCLFRRCMAWYDCSQGKTKGAHWFLLRLIAPLAVLSGECVSVSSALTGGGERVAFFGEDSALCDDCKLQGPSFSLVSARTVAPQQVSEVNNLWHMGQCS